MNESHGRIPHALATAHRELSVALDEAIEQYSRNQNFSNANDVCRNIERFVDALYRHPDGESELHKRAKLVEKLCGPESDYETIRSEALRGYQGQPLLTDQGQLSPDDQGQPRNWTGSDLAVTILRNSPRVPRYLSVIARLRQNIECILNEESLNLSATSRHAYENWSNACRAIQRESDQLEVDGCWYLLYIHEAGEGSPSEHGREAKGMTLGNMGGANLEGIKAAVDSLVDWAGRSQDTDPGLFEAHSNLPTDQQVSRQNEKLKKAKRSTQKGEGREKLIAALTKHHDYADGGCLNTEPIGNNELARLADVAASTASRFFNNQFGGPDKKVATRITRSFAGTPHA